MAYSSIVKPSVYFNTKLYTGNGTNATGITGVGFQPDWVWIKERSSTSPHKLLDAVRGATKELESSSTDAEATESTSLQSFNSDGFTVGTNGAVNENSQTYASWNWKANGTGSSNTDGSITSTVSANTTSGFSIVSWNGNSGTVGHGLGVKPAMIILKSRQSTTNWVVMHKGLGNMDTNILVLNTTTGADSGGSGMAEPTSSVFTMASGLSPNDNLIAYCFAEKQGYSKFGSYTGNGNNDGTFVYTGFKPAFVMIKRTSNTDNWYMKDNKRSGTAALQDFGQMNPNQTQHPSANNNSAENKASAFATDILSNGFKLRGTDSGLNQSGESYIYMCFAEEPLVSNSGTDGVPATAR